MNYIIIGILIYLVLLVLICVFLKGATQLGNEYDERMEIEMTMKKLYGDKK